MRKQQAAQQADVRAARDRAVAALQEEYEAGQRTRQIDLLRRENLVKDADLRSRRMLQLLTTLAALLTVAAGIFVYVLYRRSAGSNVRLNQLNTQLTYHSQHDALTGLYNRRSFLEKMAARPAHDERERRGDALQGVDCIVLMDIDHFKHINDRWGHGVGDTVLMEVAHRLTAAVRDSDMVIRWGGEEFLIYAPGADPAHIAEIVSRVLHGTGATPVDAGTCSVPVTLTAGVVTLPFAGVPDSGFEWERGIRLADWALYHGKANGRNQARIVTRLSAPVDTVLAALDGAAAAEGLVDMECVHGPAQPAT
ncbi:GGDEF domain-containing protein [Massilia pseudoviolaceinigra]|uniref:GGDEF domain-containing protein n=1 Tax=Massilia pseudoviolaceinigra TaxID=3057165 RepID=UPI0027965D21|nr:GGDEF domain-containing protein [Massilia sp. CCM 9206]MDQ1923625.1 GGDEF domain-containing protein [Massilia sp. CCM 9206]